LKSTDNKMTAPPVQERRGRNESAPSGSTPKVAPQLTIKQYLELIKVQLANDRSGFLSHWRELGKMISPTRARVNTPEPDQTSNRGDRWNRGNIVDSTATFAARTLMSGMMSAITNPAFRWFKLSTPDPQKNALASVKDWLDQATQIIETILLRSNYYNVLPTVYLDLGIFGIGTMLMDADDEQVIRCYPFEVGTYFLGCDEKNEVRIFIRDLGMTVRQLVDKFGFDQCSTSVQAAWRNGRTEQFTAVTHAIVPNTEYDGSRLDSKRFKSVYYETSKGGADKVLRESGYDHFPVMAPRWAIGAGDVYATDSPGMTALGDVRELQFDTKRLMEGIDKQVRPPMVGNSSLKSVRVSMLSGDITYDDSNKESGLRPMFEVKPDLKGLTGHLMEIRSRIKTSFFEDLFLMISSLEGDQRTATEIAERKEEKLIALGPVLWSVDEELLDPTIARVFALVYEAGRFPPPPKELEGAELKVEYTSIMHQAQKAAALAQIDRLAAFVLNLAAQAKDPSVLDKIDVDEMIAKYADASGVPPQVIRPDDAVAALRAARKKQQMDAQQAEQLKSAGAGAKSLSQADTGGKNALTDIIKNLPAAQQQAGVS
jgi:hypothetical protein